MMTFQDLNIPEPLCELLRQHGIEEPTSVQEQAIPAVRSGKDLMVQSRTGTGKTLAFLLPVMEKIKKGVPTAQALIVVPTRELAVQISKVASIVGQTADVTSLVIYGGQDIERQKEKLRRHPRKMKGSRKRSALRKRIGRPYLCGTCATGTQIKAKKYWPGCTTAASARKQTAKKR